MTTDEIVRLLEAHQHCSSVTDACTCGAGDRDTLQPSGTSTVKHWRHLARVIKAEFDGFHVDAVDPDCSGLGGCPAMLHVHGCPVDDGFNACDTPEAHDD